MLFQRDFLEDSDSSYEMEEEDAGQVRYDTQEEQYYPAPTYEPQNSYPRSSSIAIQNHHQPSYRDVSPQAYTNSHYRDTSPKPNTHYRDVSPKPSTSTRDYQDTSSRPYTSTRNYQDTSSQSYGNKQHRDASPHQYQPPRDFESESYNTHTQDSWQRPDEEFQPQHQSQFQSSHQSQYQRGHTPKAPEYSPISGYSGPRLQEESELQRPRTNTVNQARPTSASAQMRMKMLEQQKNKLTQKRDTSTMQVTSNSNYKAPGMGQDSTGLNSFIYSTGILAEQDLKTNKDLKDFAAPSYKFEPSTLKMREAEKLPGPIKAERIVFKDDLEEEVLEEPTPLKNPPTVTPREFQAPRDLPTDKQQLKQAIVLEESLPVAYTAPAFASTPAIPFHPSSSDVSNIRQPDPTYPPASSPIVERPVPQNRAYIPREEIESSSNHPRYSPLPERPAPQSRSYLPEVPAESSSNQPRYSPLPEKPTPQSRSYVPEAPAETRGSQETPQSGPVVESENIPRSMAPPSSELDMIPQPPPDQVFQILQNEMRDMKRFLKRPLPKGIMLQCSISRKKSGMSRIYPKYYMHTSEDNKFLLAGKKRANNRTSNYLISMEKDALSVKSPYYMGKVRSNFMGTRFTMYDIGLNPKHKGANAMNSREELGVVYYESNIFGPNGPRKMKILLPAVNSAGDHFIWKPISKAETMVSKHDTGDTAGMFSFMNKAPKWNESIKAYVLNFNGRVDKASVKNFQLVDDRDDNKIYLQFGRTSETTFTLDFQWPFSPFQAFAIALSSFDNKFACE